MKYCVGVAALAAFSRTEATALVGGGRALRVDDSPADKVITLLEELEARIQGDQASDQNIYDKYACWCEEATHRKATQIDDAKTELKTLGTMILTQKGVVIQRTGELADGSSSIKDNEEAQALATSIRSKENAEWQADSAEMGEAIAALNKAIHVLTDATQFVQLRSGAAAREEAARRVQKAMDVMPLRAIAKVPEAKLSLLRQMSSDLSHSKDTSKYAPQSATIQGILRQMITTFAADLQGLMKDEATRNRDFEDLIATKQEELATLEGDQAVMEAEKAEAEMMLAEATQAYDDTEKQMTADIDFFDITKDACTNKTDEWDIRKKAHEDELAAIGQALGILKSPESQAMFAKLSFMQVSSANHVAAPSQRAFETLKSHARGAHSLRLARLAAQVKLSKSGHFDGVIKAIDDMLVILQEESKADIKQRDECKTEFQNIRSAVADLEWKNQVSEALIEKLTGQIADSEAEKTKTQGEITDVETEMTDMTTTRTQENSDFLQRKEDLENAWSVLNSTKVALAAWYGKQSSKDAEFIQRTGAHQPNFKVSEDQAPDAELTDHGTRSGEAKGIVDLIGLLMENFENDIKSSQAGEASAQIQYEKQMEAAQKLKESLEEKVVTLETFIAERNGAKSAEESTLTENQGLLQGQNDYKDSITPDCDWILGAMEKRHKQRTAEAEGLTQAKEFLAGAAPPS